MRVPDELSSPRLEAVVNGRAFDAQYGLAPLQPDGLVPRTGRNFDRAFAGARRHSF